MPRRPNRRLVPAVPGLPARVAPSDLIGVTTPIVDGLLAATPKSDITQVMLIVDPGGKAPVFTGPTDLAPPPPPITIPYFPGGPG